MIVLLEYEDAEGRRPFGKWLDGLSIEATVRVDVALGRLEAGNFSNVKGAGAGVFELRVNFGPGYRVYFGKDGENVVLLLAGGLKKGQRRDIVTARSRWIDYKVQKKEGNKTDAPGAEFHRDRS